MTLYRGRLTEDLHFGRSAKVLLEIRHPFFPRPTFHEFEVHDGWLSEGTMIRLGSRVIVGSVESGTGKEPSVLTVIAGPESRVEPVEAELPAGLRAD